MENARAIFIGGAATLIIIGGIIYTQLDNWFTPEPTGPGSGDVVEHDPMYDGPGSGDFAEYDHPGSDDYDAGLEHDPVYDGPGSGDFDNTPEPTGPGSGDEIDPNEPTGPGSGDEMPGPEEPGPGSGDEADVVGSCNTIDDASICVDYIGSFWTTPALEAANCDGVGVYKKGVPCPQPTSGACQVSAGTDYESLIWYYPYGGDPFVGDLIGYAAGTCNASGGNFIFGS